MIVLDEQLMGRGIEDHIAKWYRGKVCFVTDLRPTGVIKDDLIPKLLQQQNNPTFITINEKDFWRRVPINKSFCVVCFSFSDSQAHEIPDKLRTMLKMPAFHTKKSRMGKVLRVTNHEIYHYSATSSRLQTINI